MPRPLPALPGASSEPPERERPNSAASNASHPKEYRMMALQQIRNSLEPFANQQEQLQLHHHVQVGAGGHPGAHQGQPPPPLPQQSPQHHAHSMKRSEMSSASSTASESSYGYSAFNALPPKTPVRPPEVVQRSQSCGPRKPPARLPPEQPSQLTDERLSSLTNGAAALQQQRAANQSALLGLKALRLTSATPDPTGTPLWEKLPVAVPNCAATSSSANSAASDSGVELSPSVRSILPDPPRLLQTPEYYQSPAPVLYPKNVPSGEPPPPPPPRPDRHSGPPHPAPPPIQGPKPQAAVAKKYTSHSNHGHQLTMASAGGSVPPGGVPQREPPPPYTIYSPPSISSTYSALSYASSSSGGRLSPTNTGSSSECSIPILPRRTPPPNPPVSVSPQPSVASLGSSISMSSSTLSCPSKPATNGASGGHCLQGVPPPQQAASWAVKKAKSQSPIIMHSVKATPIQKPVPQTAVAPPSRPVPPVPSAGGPGVIGGVVVHGSAAVSASSAASGGFGTPPPYLCPPPAYPRRGPVVAAGGCGPDQQSPYISSTPPPLPPPRTVSPPLPPPPPSGSTSASPAPGVSTPQQQQQQHPLLAGQAGASPATTTTISGVTVTTRGGGGGGGGCNSGTGTPVIPHGNHSMLPQAPSPSPSAAGSIASLSSSIASASLPTNEPPSYASSVAALAAAVAGHRGPSSPAPAAITAASHLHSHPHAPPQLPMPLLQHQQQQQQQQHQSQALAPPARGLSSDLVMTVSSICQSQVSALQGTNPSHDHTNVDSSSSRSESPVTDSYSLSVGGAPSSISGVVVGGPSIGHLSGGPHPSGGELGVGPSSKDVEGGSSEEPIRHQSPIPPRKKWSIERDDAKVRNYSPDAYKFFMEQHVENVMKNHHQRQQRRQQLETEMAKVGLSSEAQMHIRRMLHQKESNYIRLRRAKMEISMFHKIAIIGMGAFGEVALVKKVDTQQLYAMKTLRKEDVLKRNQVAHVKAERDILAEADNEWVVKLYYSFQDQNSLYFVMDYIAGGDMMTLLIKFGVFEESLARFYIAELTCALESVHKLGFIHRDIKPDNILIDRDGHIKLTDFGLCTGFRWTHNSKYYQRGGDHARQDSMDLNACDEEDCSCKKPLERRRRKDQQRSLARSLVGTPNYIAPEVLLRQGYGQACDWWSVGVILYEMLIGQAPFHASKPAETQYKVIHWETHLTFPPVPQLSLEANSLIRALCTNQEKRLGAKGAQEIKAHPFFAGIDFDGGVRKTTAPYIPQIRYPADTSNFDKYEMPLSGIDDAAKGLNDMPPERDGDHAFLEFTFRRFFDDGGQAYPLRLVGQIQEEQETPQVDAKGNPVYV